MPFVCKISLKKATLVYVEVNKYFIYRKIVS